MSDTLMALLVLLVFFSAVTLFGADEMLRCREERRFREQIEEDARRSP